MVRLSPQLCMAASVFSAYCAGGLATPFVGLSALDLSRQSGGAALAVSSLLFPGTKLFLRLPEDSARHFSPPFEAMPGLTGGPVLPVNADFAVCPIDSGIGQPVLGRTWEQDIAAHLLSGVWSACGTQDNLTSDELSRTSSRLHHQALEMARSKAGVGQAFPDVDDIFNPFERAFCFINAALEERGWPPGAGSVCIDIIRFAFRSELDSKGLNENAIVISVIPPGVDFRNEDGSTRTATFEERLDAVAELGAKLIDAVYYYNTEIGPRLVSLPFVELVRLSPLPLPDDEALSKDREKGEEESGDAISFFDIPDDAPMDESLAYSRALLKGMSRSYISLREIFLKKCEKTKKRNAGLTRAKLTPGRGHTQGTGQDGTKDSMKRTNAKIRCMRFPLPVIDLAYDAVTSFATALKAEEEAVIAVGA